MKLPEYDNRPAPGTPLYDNSADGELEDIKFTVLGIGLSGGTLACFSVAFALLLLTLFN